MFLQSYKYVLWCLLLNSVARSWPSKRSAAYSPPYFEEESLAGLGFHNYGDHNLADELAWYIKSGRPIDNVNRETLEDYILEQLANKGSVTLTPRTGRRR